MVHYWEILAELELWDSVWNNKWSWWVWENQEVKEVKGKHEIQKPLGTQLVHGLEIEQHQTCRIINNNCMI